MQQAFRPVFFEQRAHRRPVHDIAAYPPDAGDVRGRAVAIKAQYGKPTLNQRRQTMTAQEPGSAGHQYRVCRRHALAPLKKLGQFSSCGEITLTASGHMMLKAGSSWRAPVALC